MKAFNIICCLIVLIATGYAQYTDILPTSTTIPMYILFSLVALFWLSQKKYAKKH